MFITLLQFQSIEIVTCKQFKWHEKNSKKKLHHCFPIAIFQTLGTKFWYYTEFAKCRQSTTILDYGKSTRSKGILRRKRDTWWKWTSGS